MLQQRTTSVSCGGNGNVTVSDPVAGANNSACGELSGDTYTITYTVTDNCGRTASCEQTFTIQNAEPTISCPADATVECLSDVVGDASAATTSVSCGGNGNVTVSDPVAGANNSACGELSGDTYTITYTVTDNCGRTAECSQTFTIQNAEPTISCPADATVECLSDVVGDASAATTSVSCGGNGNVTVSDPVAGANNSACGELSGDTYTITYTVTDNCGRTAECSQTFTIQNAEPTITCPADATVECLSDVQADIAGTTTSVSCGGDGNVTASDPVPGANNSACGELSGDTYTITYTVTDNCGRTAECSQTFTIQNAEPTITCPADATVECLSDVQADIAGTTTSVSCGGDGNVTASDPVPGANNSACGELSGDTYTITYTVTDNCGRTAECSQTFTIQNAEPTITCPADATVECLSDVQADIAGTTTSVSCGGDGNVTASDPVPGANNSACGELSGDTYTITYTVTDNCGRTAECSQTFTIQNAEPTITCPADATVECLSDVQADIAGTTTSVSCGGDGNVTASDPVPGANNSACGELSGDTYTITYTVTDNCGRTAECSQTFTIQNAEPTITCPADATVECLSDVQADIAGTTTSVSCGGDGNVTASDPVPGANNSACGELSGDTYTITYTVTDNCGRTAECSQTFTIQNAEPTITCPADATVECLSDVQADIAGTTTSVSCGGDGNVTASDPVPGANNSACGELSGDTYTITYTVTDNCGRTAECSQTFTIQNAEPTITCPADATVECLSDVQADIAGTTTSVSCGGDGNVTASDPVPGANNSACGELSGDTYTITYTVTDNCGRTAECSQTFTIQNAEPTITCPADATVECLSDVQADIAGTTTSVSCGGDGNVTASDPVPGANNSACGELSGDTYTITYTVTDNCGRTAECSQTFTIQNAEPTITCPADATVECLSDVQADIAGTTTSVSCGGDGNVTASDPVPGANNSACGELSGDTYTITYTVTDNCGRTAECSQTFTIQNAEPTITCPADATVECLSDVQADIAGTTTSVSCGGDGNVTASDPVPGANNSACGELSGDTYTITYTVTDNCGRTAECSQTFTIQNAEPTITCPADATVECLSDVQADIAGTTTSVSCGGDGNVTASDPVPGANNSACGELSGDTYTITYTVTDNCGRTAECSQTFTIQNAEPTITCPADATVECLSDVQADIAGTTTSVSCGGDGNVTASDPVPGANNSACGELSGDTYTITYTVTDNCGRTAECSQTFTIQNAEPTITCPADATVECLSDVQADIAGTTTSVSCGGDGNVTASDPVPGANNSACGELSGDTYTITYTVTDNCGRTAECSQTFTIQNAEPTITCPADATVECLSDVQADIAGTTTSVSCGGDGNVTASDPVPGANNSACGELSGDTYTITYTVTDNCGRTAECSQTFTIQNAEPTITCPADATVECLSDVQADIAGTTTSVSCGGDGNVTASDPVPGANNSACGELSGDTYTITYTVTDNCGRTAECSQTFTIQNAEPTITCPADATVECLSDVQADIAGTTTSVSCGGDGNVTASDPVPGANNSACGELSGDTYTITYTVTDNCGRTAECSQTFTIQNAEPTITCPADATVECLSDVQADIAGTTTSVSCGGDGNVTASDPVPGANNSACGELSGDTYTITYTVTDNCGRTAECSQTFTIQNAEPTITCPADATVECLSDVQADIAGTTTSVSCGGDGNVTASDPVPGANNSACGELSGDTYTITYTVTDNCGRTAECSQTFTIQNAEPTITCPADATVECLSDVQADIAGTTTSVSCGGDGNVTASDPVPGANNSACGELSGDTYTITYTVTDNCGRTAECSQTFTIQNAEPTITCPADATVECLSDVQADIAGTTTSVSCGGDGNVTASDPVPGANNSACGELSGDTYTITYTVTDNCGRTAECSQTFTIQNAEPTITCPADATVECLSDVQADIAGTTTSVSCGGDGNVTASDPVPGANNSACGELSGDTYTITYTVTDNCGRTAECSQTFTIQNAEPTITCPADATVECLSDVQADIAGTTTSVSCGGDGNVTASDPVPGANNSACGELSGDTYTITYTVTDNCGRTAECSQTFTIQNAEPTITCPADATVECLSDVQADIAGTTTSVSCGGDGNVTASDPVPGANNSACGELSGDTYTITYTVTDNCGRTAECSQTFTIQNAEPTITCPADATVECLSDVQADIAGTTTSVSCGGDGNVTASDPVPGANNSACGELSGDTYTITYTVTDNCGRTAECSQTFTIQNAEPTITCPADATVECLSDVQADIAGTTTSVSCGGDGNVTASDPVPGANNSACGELSGDTYTITYTVTDNCGRTAECSQTFTIQNAEPTITCPADATVECLSDVQADIAGTTTSVSCGGDGNVTASDPVPGANNSACGELSGDTYTITYTVTDNCGRTAECSQTFTIQNAEPTITCPADATVECLSDVQADIAGTTTSVSCGGDGNVTASDPVPGANNSACGELSGDTYTITYTVTDNCGRTAECSQTFTIQNAEPTITCPADATVECLSDVQADIAGTTTSVSCGGDGNVTASDPVPGANNSACGELSGDTYTITYTVTDNCGRTAECSQTFTIQNAEPTITCPADATVECLSDVQADIAGTTTSVSCGGDGNVTASDPVPGANNSACGELSGDTYTITYTVTDNCGRTAECSQTFTIQNAEPTITCPADATVECLSDVQADIAGTTTSVSCGGDGNVTASDPVPGANNSACGELSGDTYTITYTVTDNCGRTAECSQTFTIQNAEPTITCPADATVECLSDVQADIAGTTTSVSCGGDGNVTASDPVPGANNSACGELSGDTYTITYTVTDNCGRTAECSQTFTIQNAEPTITCPADATVECLSDVQADIAGTTTSVSCGGDGNVTASDPVPGANNSACGELSGDTYTITYTVTDNCGRTAECSQTFTIQNAEPTITCPADATVECLSDVQADIAGTTTSVSCGGDGNVTASDPVPGANNSACGELSGDTYTITYTVTDNCGRTAECSQTFTIQNAEPTITCPADATVECLSDVQADIAGTTTSVSCGGDGNVTASDPVPGANNSACGELSGDTYTITYTVTDNCGRTAECSQTFTIQNAEPTITCPADATVECLSDVQADIAGITTSVSCGGDGNVTASDPVPGANNSACGELSGDTYTITYTVTDNCGRTAECSQTFTIQNAEPSITCPADATVECLSDVVGDASAATTSVSCGGDGNVTVSDPVPGANNSACGELSGDTYTITYTVTDNCGRTAECSQTFTIQNAEPSIICPADATVECLSDVVGDASAATTSVSCGGDGNVTVSDPVPGANNSACGELSGDTYTITYTVTDNCGRTAECSQTFTIQNAEPSITCPADATVECLSDVVGDASAATTSVSCGGDGNVTVSDPVPGANNSACGELSGDTYTITYTVTDNCGRTAECSQTFTIQNAEPSITCPADATVECLSDIQADIAGTTTSVSCGGDGNVTASDPVPGANNSACGELDGDTYTITYTVTDNCGRTAECSQTFTIDSAEPTITCPADATVECLSDVVADIAGTNATGGCDGAANVTASDPVPGANNSACGELDGDTYTITYTVTDDCGRTAECTQTFTIDSAEPTITCPADATVECLSDVVADIAGANATGGCDGAANVTASDPVPGANNSACGELDGDTYTITYTVTDDCGRTAECTQTFTIDSAEPTITCPADATVECLSDVVADIAGANATGGCDGAANVTASDPVPGANNSACGELDGDTYTITYTVTDDCGRTAECTQTFTIDSAEPTITCPADATVECLSDVVADIAGTNATGGCDGAANVTASDPVPGANNSACGELDGDTYTITYTVTDDCGRTAECTQTFTIDSAEPTITCPADATVECLSDVVADIAGANATGGCDGAANVTASDPVPGANNSACGELDGDTYTITYTVTDDCGRTAECTQTFTIDSAEPTITCPADATVECLSDVVADIAGANATGGCDGAANVTASDPVPGANNSACGELDGDTYTITYTVTDNCGRTAECTQTFTIDSAEPTITCPADATVECLSDVVADIAGANATGGCDGAANVTASDPVPGANNSACGELDGDTYTITYTVTDDCGRTAECTQTFTIDSAEPTITCPADATVECLSDVVADIAGANATGGCDGAANVTASDPVPGANNSACGELDGDTYTITYTVTDDCGRTAECTQTFTIDSAEPTITCPADATVECLSDVVADIAGANATGGCDGAANVTASDPVPGANNSACGELDGDTYTITYTVTDNCGRTAECTQTFTIDSAEPTITCPADATVECLSDVVADIAGTNATGGCDGAANVTASDPVPGANNSACGELDGDTYTITYTVTDNCGRTAECTQTFTIDSAEPTITCPADATVECLSDVVADIAGANATGGCDGAANVTASDPVPGTGNSACGELDGDTYTITYTVTDNCGRTAECTQTFTIDSAEPTITCPADATVECLSDVVADIAGTDATGGCDGGANVTASDPIPGTGNSACGELDGDTYTITYTVTDNCGRTAECTQTFTIDSAEPTITCPADATVECLSDVVADIAGTDATGGCDGGANVTASDPIPGTGNSACGELDGDTYTITYTVTDNCGRTAECTQTFTIDSAEPTITCPADATVECLSDVVADIAGTNATGGCDGAANVTASDPVPGTGNSACGELDGDTYTITYAVTDNCGRIAECTQTFTIDSAEPTITCPADATVECLSDVVADIAGTNATGGCDGGANVTASDPVPGTGNSACGELDGDTYTITYTVTDNCGRIAECTQTFTIDSAEPTITCPADATVECLSDVVADIAGANATGGCDGGANVTASDPVPGTGNSACGELDGDTYTITYTVTDNCGRIAECTQTFTIDSAEPDIHCPDDVTVTCLSDVVADLANITTTGSCGTDGTVSASDPQPLAGNSTCGELDGDQYVITYTVTDACGRTAECSQLFTIDSAEPTITCAADVTVTCLSDVVGDVSSVTATGGCDGSANVTAGDAVPGTGNSACGELDGDTYTITYTVTDNCGRTAECTQTFTIDSAEPTITCAGDVTVTCLSDVVGDVSSVTATGGCDGSANVTAGDAVPGTGNSACGELDGDTYTITYTVTDNCGRTAECIRTFTIDSAEPTISCAGDVTVTCLSDVVGDVSSVTATGGCDGSANVTAGDAVPGTGNSACGELDGDTYTITYTVTDNCGRTAECTQTFTIDSAEPTISCAGDVTVTCLSDVVGDVSSVTATGGCDGSANVTAGDAVPGTGNSACGELDGDTYTITYTVTDNCGRTAECTQTFTIDSAEPTISCAGDVTVTCLSDVVGDVSSVTATGGCDGSANVTAGDAVPGTGNSACGELDGDTYTITYTVTDNCGRTAECTQTFTIDSAEPTISCAGDVTVTCLSDVVGDVSSVTATGGCDGSANVTAGDAVPGTGNSACGELDGDTYTITYTVTDNCGRTAECTQTFTIDSAEPTISCAGDVTVTCLSDVIGDVSSVTATGGCDGSANVTAGDAVPGTGNSACGELDGDTYTITYTVTDNCGRTAECTQTFTIDSAEPTISCAGNVTVTCLSDVIGDVSSVTATGGCDGSANVTAGNPVAGANNSACGELDGDTYTITYTVTDNCGRTAECTQTFTIDSAEPTISCAGDLTVTCLSDVVGDVSSVTATGGCDGGANVTVGNPVAGANNSACGELDGDTYTITYTVTDNCGRTAECTQTFTIDSAEPTISCAGDLTVTCLSDVVGDVSSVTATGGCDGGANVTAGNPVAGANNSACGELDGDTYTITYTVTDNCGRTAECTQTFTIDSAEPTISCAGDLTVTCLSDVVGDVSSVTATGGCDGSANVSVGNPVAGANNSTCGELDGDTYTITYTVTDNCGRTAECTQTFTIDSAEPDIHCPDDVTVTCLSDVVANVASIVTTGSCGNDGGAVTASDPQPLAGNSACGELDGDQYVITYTVTDACGRTAECSQLFTIDSDEPTISCAGNITAACKEDIVADLSGVTVTGSCGDNGNVTSSDPVLISGTDNCDGAVYEITYTVTDACGRTAECTQSVTLDVSATTIDVPANMTVVCEDEIIGTDPTVTVGCGIGYEVVVGDLVFVSGSRGCDGAIYEINYTVTTDCGEVVEATTTFTIDNSGTIDISCDPSDIVIECAVDGSNQTEAENWNEANIDKLLACSGASCAGELIVTSDFDVANATGSCAGNSLTVKYTIQGPCGELVEKTAFLSIEDNAAPTISVQDVTVSIDPATGTVSITEGDIVTSADDSCTEVMISLDKEVFTQDDCGDNVVTITATDACGNSDTATASVTVECAYDLNLILTVDNATPQIGDKVMYMVTVTNELGYPATGVSVSSQLPNGLMSPTNIDNGGTASGNTVNWSGLTIPANGSLTLSYKAMVIAGTDYVVVAEITGADEPDIDSTPGNGADTNGTGGIGSQDNDGTQDPGDEDDGDDAVIEPTGKISGTVKTDDDNNGSGDTGLAGVTINLVDSNGNIVQSTTTDGNGFYEFTNVPAGDYFIEEVDLPGFSDVSDTDDTTGANDPDGANDPTNDRIPVTLAPGEFDDGNNFVEVGLGSISGIVSEDTNGDGIGDNPISGVTITLLDSNGNTVATTTTNGTGFYEFVDLTPGNYTVVETQPNGLFDVSDEDASPDPDGADGVVDNRIPVTLDAGESDEDNNFVEVGQGTISGFVLADEDNNDTGDLPISGVQIVLKDAGGATIATENTNGSGFYEFVGLAPGNYTLMEMQPNGFDDVSDEDATPDPDGADGVVNNSIPVVLDAGENDADNNFIEEAFVSVGSTVFIDSDNNGQQDSGENGISGIRVELYSGGNLVGSTTTDGSGNYFFGDLAPGDYIVTIPNPDSAYPTSSTGNAGDNGVDGDDNGIQANSGGSTSSPTISLLPNQETANEPFSGGNQDNAEDFNGDMTVDFGFYAPGSIGDFVWFDLNGDGNQDGGEPGLANVTVNLLDGNGNQIATTTSGSNGGYIFTGLAPGDYIVEFITPASYTEVVQTSGTTPDNGSSNSDYNPTNGRTAVISLGGGENIAGIDGGFNLILEVALTSFTGRYVEDRDINALSWTTSSEVNSDYFIVERSFNNSDFEAIGRVEAVGNTTEETTYNLDDTQIAAAGTYLYRLQMVNTDGSIEFSDVISISVRRSLISEPSVKLYPNPSYDQVNVDIVKNEDDQVSVTMFDVTGKVISISNIAISSNGNNAMITVPVSNIARGSYILRINVGDQVFAKKVLLVK